VLKMETLGGNSSSSPSLSSASSSSSFGGINTDDNNGGVTWYGMRLPVNPFLSPISFLLDYSGILRSSNDSEGMIVNNGVSGSELRSQVDAGGAVAGSSAGEVAIRIIGAGENIHNQDGEVGYDDCGEELIGERSGMPGLGENDAEGRGGIEASEGVPLVSSSSSSSLAGSGQVDGEAAGNGTENNRDSSSHQRYDIQLVAKWIEQILPFSLLLLVVFIRQHLQGIITSVLIH
jgi:E3 ubiquitin-protein ligase RNFT1